jgi:hypothetical protein
MFYILFFLSQMKITREFIPMCLHVYKKRYFSSNNTNMKLLSAFLLFLFIIKGINTNAQYTSNRFYINAKYGYGAFTTKDFHVFGLTANWVVHDKVSVNYQFEYLNRNDDVRHIHTPLGLIGGPILLLAGLANAADGDTTTSGGGTAFLGLLAFVLPDGASFHQNIGFRGDISPYANILGIDFIKDRESGYKSIKYSCSLGVKLTYILAEKMAISGFIEARKVASIPVGLAGGIQLGYGLGTR